MLRLVNHWPNRWMLIAPWAIIIAMVLGWTGYWFSLSGQITRQLEDARRGLGGYGQLSFAGIEISGYPFRLIASLKDARLDGPDGAYQVSAPRAQVAINVLNPDHLLVFADNPIAWRGLGLDWSITAERAEASIRVLPQGIGESRFALTNAAIAAPNTPPSTMTAATIGIRRDPADVDARQIAVTLEGFGPALVRGFEGFSGERMHLMAGLVLERAATVQPGRDPFGPWAQSGARLRVERFQVRRPGFAAAAEGAFSLDGDRRPIGSVAITFDDPAAGAASVAASGTIPAARRSDADAFVAGQGVAGGAAPLTLTAQDGRWRFGSGGGAGGQILDLGEAAPLYPHTTTVQ